MREYNPSIFTVQIGVRFRAVGLDLPMPFFRRVRRLVGDGRVESRVVVFSARRFPEHLVAREQNFFPLLLPCPRPLEGCARRDRVLVGGGAVVVLAVGGGCTGGGDGTGAAGLLTWYLHSDVLQGDVLPVNIFHVVLKVRRKKNAPSNPRKKLDVFFSTANLHAN